jgi:glutamine synthetase
LKDFKIEVDALIESKDMKKMMPSSLREYIKVSKKYPLKEMVTAKRGK